MKRGVALLVYANKQDLPSALPVEKLVECLHLHTINNTWHIQRSIATTGAGLFEGLEWLASAVKQKVY